MGAATILITFLVFPATLVPHLARLSGSSKRWDALVMVSAIGLAPAMVSLLLYWLFLLFPGADRLTCIGAVALVFLISAVGGVGWVRGRRFAKRPYQVGGDLAARSAFLAAAGITAVMVLYIGTAFPIDTTDALRHAYVGRRFFLDRSLAHYPLMETLPDGFNHNMRYPPGLHLLYSWLFLLQGSAKPDTVIRLVAPLYYALTAILAGSLVARNHGRLAGAVSGFFCITCPIFAHQAAINHIDMFRIFLMVVAFAWGTEAVRTRRWSPWVVVALAVAAGVGVHAIGVIIAISMGLMFVVSMRDQLPQRPWRFAGGLLLLVGAAALGGVEYVRRIVLGVTWKGPTLYFPLNWEQLLDGRGLSTTRDVIVHGILALWTKPALYGTIPWFAALVCVVAAIRRNTAALGQTARWALAFAALLAMLIWFAPISPPGWRNPRYILTIVPLLAIAVGPVVAAAIRASNDRLAVALRIPRSVALTVIGLGVVLAVLAVVMTPDLSALLLSPDGVIEAPSVRKVQVGRVLMGTAGLTLSGLGVILGLRRRVRFSMRFLLVGLLVGLCALSVLPAWRAMCGDKGIRSINKLRLRDLRGSVWHKLERRDRGDIGSILFLRAVAGPEDRVLITEEASSPYYGTYNALFWRDLTMKPFYEAPTCEAALNALHALGITYIQASDRSLETPEAQESYLDDIVYRSEGVRRVWSGGRWLAVTVYRITYRESR
jgi:hypothetical protein